MIELHIPDMSCGHCKKAIQDAVQAADQSATVQFDMQARYAMIESSTNSAELIKVLAEAGYPATVV